MEPVSYLVFSFTELSATGADAATMTVKERAAECQFTADFYEQAVRDKLTFSCKEDN